jgi:hypothetical protein
MPDTISSRNDKSRAALRSKSLFSGIRPVMKLAVLVWLAFCMQAVASAQNTTEKWNGSDGTGLWSHGKNWTPNLEGGPNGSQYNVVIPATTKPQPTLDVSATIYDLNINLSASLTVNKTLTVLGLDLVNNGSVGVGVSGTLLFPNDTTLSGIGTVNLEASQALIGGNGTLTNLQDISGYGIIDVKTLKNEGQIQGTSSTDPLNIGRVTGGSVVMNSGLISTLNFGTVVIRYKTTVQNAGGRVSGGSGNVTLNGCTIVGGTLQETLYQGYFTTTLNGVTIAAMATYGITAAASGVTETILMGTITNNGQIIVTSPPGTGKAELTTNGAATLTGTGSVTVIGQNAFLDGTGTLTNMQSISSSGGSANITVKKFVDQGKVTSNSLAGLTFQVPGGITNTGGTITSAGNIIFKGGTLSGGVLSTNSDSVMNFTLGFTIDGGAYITGKGTDYGVKVTLNGSSPPPNSGIVPAASAAITNSGTVEIDNADQTTLIGTINNTGEFFINASCFSCGNAVLAVSGNVNLTGTGTITMANSPYNIVTGATGSDTLINNSNTIEGAGNIGNGQMSLTNGAKGTIYANQGYPLIISPGSGHSFNNSGTLSAASPNSILEITGGTFSNFNSGTGTLTGGKYDIAGTLQFDNANIVHNAANITLGPPPGQILNHSNGNALFNFSDNLVGGSFTLAEGENFTTLGLFTNAGFMTVEKSSTFTVGGTSKNYNQTGGTTTVDGTLTVPAGGLVNVTGGTLEGAGTLSGSFSLGNASGATATFIVGDNIKKAAPVSISDKYTQLATGVLDLQIGGTKAGTTYSQLSVTDLVRLGGTLNISLINKFTPVIGQTFIILRGPSGITGTFAKVNGLSINSTEHFEVNYDATTLVLDVVSGP